jgi:uncharacterized protein
MHPQVAEAAAEPLTDLTEEAHPVGIIWHGGEPLAVEPEKFAALLGPCERLRQQGRVHHYVQTNATLVTDTWCKLLSDHEVRVSVSIDGPAALNADRVDLRGKPAFEGIQRCIQRLRDHGDPFSVISVVVTTSATRPEELLEFLTKLGCTSAGFNIKEVEGVNTGRQATTTEQAEEFWYRTLTWPRSHGGGLRVRELERLAEYLYVIRTGQRADWDKQHLDPISTVSVTGDVVLLSPELAATTDPIYGDFLAGNVLHQPLAAILDGAHRLRYVRDSLTGLENRRAECAFSDFCRGARPPSAISSTAALRPPRPTTAGSPGKPWSRPCPPSRSPPGGLAPSASQAEHVERRRVRELWARACAASSPIMSSSTGTASAFPHTPKHPRHGNPNSDPHPTRLSPHHSARETGPDTTGLATIPSSLPLRASRARRVDQASMSSITKEETEQLRRLLFGISGDPFLGMLSCCGFCFDG